MGLARWLVPAAVLALSLVPVSASAHPVLVSATPPAGSSAPAAPDRIVLSFAEALDPAATSASLVGPDGHPTPWPATVSGGTLALQPPGLPAGTWRVRWVVAGADGDRETGDYRFVVTAAPDAVTPATGPGPPGTVERAGRLLMLVAGVPLVGLLLLGPVLLPPEPERRPRTGARLAAARTGLWTLQLVGLLGYAAGLIAAGGSGMLLMSSAGPPLLIAIGVTAALGVAVFDGGALRAGEPASWPTMLLGMGLAPVLLAGLVLLAEAPSADLVPTVGWVVLLGALGAAGVAVATGAAGRLSSAPRTSETPRALILPGAVAPRFERAPDHHVPTPARGHPLPAGTTLHRRLSGHFVDLARLLESLEWTSFTGYVRVEDGPLDGVLVLLDGAVAAACLGGEAPVSGAEAVQRMIRDVGAGRALLDVVGLDHETAGAVVDLLSAPTLFAGLHTRMVNLDGVLEDLCARARDGTVVVTAPEDTGVILVRAGGVHGAYTRRHPRLDDTPHAVTALAGDADAVIEVRVAPPRAEDDEEEGRGEHEHEPRPDEILDDAGGALWDRWREARRQASGRE